MGGSSLYSLTLFGGLHLEGPGDGVAGLSSRRRPLALLALLAVAGERGVSRDHVAGLLWADTDDKHALRSLSDVLYTIRTDLSPDLIPSTVTELRLNGALVSSDVEAFRRALARGDRASAAGVYRGALLDGFHVPGVQPFEAWIDVERQRFATQYASALERLALDARDAHDVAAAVAWWRRLAAADPYNSRVAVELARDLARGRDRANGLQFLREHVALLRTELEVEPDADLLAAIEELRTWTGNAGGHSAGPSAPAGGAQPIPPSDAVEGPSASSGPAPHDAAPVPGPRRDRRTAARQLVPLLAVVVFLALVGLTVLRLGLLAGPRAHSIVVLPLRNLTGDSAAGAVVDGVTEELTARLGRVAALEVKSTTTAMQFRRTRLTAEQLARQLGIDGVVEGAVTRVKDRARITVQVIAADHDRHLGAATVDLPWDSLFAVASQLADTVLHALQVEPTAVELARVRRPVRKPAVTALLRQDRWQEALALDSNDARAWAAKSLQMAVKAWMPTRDPTWRAAPYVRAAREAADRAVQLDSTETMAWYAFGMAANYANDITVAERALRRAVVLQPSNAAARSDLAGVLALLGRTNEALEEVRHAVRLDPRSEMVRVNLNWVLLLARRWDEFDGAAAEWLRLGWSRSELIGGSQMIVTFCRGRTRETLAQVDSSLDLEGQSATKEHDLMRAIIFARLGQLDSARTIVRHAEQLTGELVRKFWLAWAYAWIGETERAVAAYRDSYAMGEGGLQGTVLTCLSDPFHRDPRWPELLGLLNIPQPK